MIDETRTISGEDVDDLRAAMARRDQAMEAFEQVVARYPEVRDAKTAVAMVIGAHDAVMRRLTRIYGLTPHDTITADGTITRTGQ